MPLTFTYCPCLLTKHSLIWVPPTIFVCPLFSFQKVTLRRKQGKAAFLNISNSILCIFDSTTAANQKWRFLSAFSVPGIIPTVLHILCPFCVTIFIPILQVRKLKFRKKRKLPQSHVTSKWRPRSQDWWTLVTLSNFLCPVIFLTKSILMLPGKPCATPERMGSDRPSHLWQYAYPCH